MKKIILGLAAFSLLTFNGLVNANSFSQNTGAVSAAKMVLLDDETAQTQDDETYNDQNQATSSDDEEQSNSDVDEENGDNNTNVNDTDNSDTDY